MKDSLEKDIALFEAEKQVPLPLLPPKTETTVEYLLRDAKKYWLHLFLAITATVLVVVGIYLDYRNTVRLEMALSQHHRCTQAMKSERMDQLFLLRLGIEDPPPTDIDSLERNVKVCLAWRTKLDTLRPIGGWSGESMAETLSKR